MARTVRDPERRAAYLAFLASPAWRDIRAAALERAGRVCAWCRCSGDAFVLHVHHKTYERFGGAELPDDLLVLCDGCHAEAHGKPYLLCKTTKRERQERRQRVKANRPPTPQEVAKAQKKARRATHWKRIAANRAARVVPDGVETASLKDRC